MKIFLIFLFFLQFFLFVYSAEKNPDTISFPVLDNWNKSEEVQIYKPENLYVYINGAADLYLSYDFEELQVIEYTSDNDKSILIEVYIHKNPVYAFGIYSREKPDHSTWLEIGTQAHFEGMSIYILVGKYYIKIMSYYLTEEEEKLLPEYAKKLVVLLNTDSSLPPILKCFPEQNKIEHSEKFVAKNFMSYDFFTYAFITEYACDDCSYSMFIMETKDKSESVSVLKKYFDFIKYKEPEINKDTYSLKDPYHGEIAFGWQDNFIWGISVSSGQVEKKKYLQLLKDNLLKGKFISD